MLRPSRLHLYCLNRLLLFLEDVVNLLKRLFALRVAQDISSLEKYGSILLEFNRNGGELPSTHIFCHEIVHFGVQGFENFWLLILLYCLKNFCLQLLPGRRLIRAGLLLKSSCSCLCCLLHRFIFLFEGLADCSCLCCILLKVRLIGRGIFESDLEGHGGSGDVHQDIDPDVQE